MLTERLILEKIDPPVLHALFLSKTKEELLAYFGFEEADYLHYLSMHQQGVETHRISMCFFNLRDKHTQRPLGECGFHTWNKTHHRAELFYRLRNEEDKNKKIMSEALQPILEFGFMNMHLNRIEALVAATNTPSVKLLNRYSFLFEATRKQDYLVNGTFEDSDAYVLLRQNWINQNR